MTDPDPKEPAAAPEIQIPEIIDTPISINEPPGSAPFPPAEEPAKSEPKPAPDTEPPHKAAHHGHSEHSDPDALEEELDEAIEDGDAEVSHKAKTKPKGRR